MNTPSIWTRGAQISAVITVLLLFANFSTAGPELLGLLVTSFIIWWLISAGVVWVYRKIRKQ